MSTLLRRRQRRPRAPLPRPLPEPGRRPQCQIRILACQAMAMLLPRRCLRFPLIAAPISTIGGSVGRRGRRRGVAFRRAGDAHRLPRPRTGRRLTDRMRMMRIPMRIPMRRRRRRRTMAARTKSSMEGTVATRASVLRLRGISEGGEEAPLPLQSIRRPARRGRSGPRQRQGPLLPAPSMKLPRRPRGRQTSTPTTAATSRACSTGAGPTGLGAA
mmetsp:Transcript_122423/g.305601  ORF Transcript_122423/g.305601 Transcript_122423/m.305601 type:complete len:215 (-) Transcript_122423:1036-1680(-)